MKIAAVAEAYEINIDQVPWRDELFTAVPEIVDGHLILPDRPGWGVDLNEEALAAHPPRPSAGLTKWH